VWINKKWYNYNNMDKNKSKLNKIISAMDDSTITTEQFVGYVEKLVDFVKSMKEMNDKEVASMRETFTQALSSVKNDSNSTLSEMKKMVSDVVQSELKKVSEISQAKMDEMMAKADALEDGKDADEEVIVTKVLGRIPAPQVDFTPVVSRIKEVEDKIVPFDYTRLERVEEMAKANAMPITTSFINGRRAKNINFTGATVSYDGDYANVAITGGGGTDVTLAGEDYLSLSGQQITANAIDLDNLSATGTPSASTFLRGDNSWATPAGSGDVSKVGTPVDNQVGVWTGDGTIEGDSALTFDTSTDTLTVGAGAGIVLTHSLKSDASAGVIIEANNGTDIGLLGAGNTANVTWYGAHNFDTATQDTIAAFTGSGKTLGSLATSTYPSLTELSYVKGVTSAIQTQLNGKANTALSNLASVAINTSLISDTDSTDDLGSSSIAWANLYVDTVRSATGNALALTPVSGSNLNVNLATTGDFTVNTNQLYVDTSAANVGIGISAPTNKLHVVNTESNGTSSTGNAFYLQSSTGAATQVLTYGVNQAGLYSYIQSFESGVGYSKTAINPNGGNVGIGTNNPSALLDVNGATETTTIELGHASDTTLSRVSAGVVAIEGVNVLTTATGLQLSGGTMTGNITLGENASIALDPAGSADGKWTGITVTGTSGYSQAFGDVVYLDPTDSRWEACDANSAAGADGDARGTLGMVVVAGTDGNACTILLNGIIRADAKFPTLTINGKIFVSETAGAITQTAPTTTDAVIRVVGAALTADEIQFAPSSDYATHT